VFGHKITGKQHRSCTTKNQQLVGGEYTREKWLMTLSLQSKTDEQAILNEG